MSSFRSVGRQFQGPAFSALSGEMTGNQKNAFCNELFGTANTSDQVARAMTMGGAAGKEAALTSIKSCLSRTSLRRPLSRRWRFSPRISSNISNVPEQAKRWSSFWKYVGETNCCNA